MKQPAGHMKKGGEHKVYKLKKATFFEESGFQNCIREHAMYVKKISFLLQMVPVVEDCDVRN